MALLKQITNQDGVITNYHKVSHVNLYDNTLTCHIDSYVSKDYRNLERNADSQIFHFGISIEEEESMGIRQLCYKKIKELDQWADAEDC